MEEDLKILEEIKDMFIHLKNYGWINDIKKDIDTDKVIRAIDHLIKAYKELKEERQIVGIPVKNKRDGRIGIVLHQWKSGTVAVLESINPRVINTHDSWNTLEIVADKVKQTQTKCETIPVSLVEEKIEELDKEYIDILSDYGNIDTDVVINIPNENVRKYCEKLVEKIIVLQQLLEGRK